MGRPLRSLAKSNIVFTDYKDKVVNRIDALRKISIVKEPNHEGIILGFFCQIKIKSRRGKSFESMDIRMSNKVV